MTPKEKAIELIKNFNLTHDIVKGQFIFHQTLDESKRCALIAINLLIECTPSMDIYPPNFQLKHLGVKEYWQEVKKEIELL
jgi:hypothetical protein